MGHVKCCKGLPTSLPSSLNVLPCPAAGVKLVMEATCIMFDEKPKMVDDPNKMGKKVANYW